MIGPRSGHSGGERGGEAAVIERVGQGLVAVGVALLLAAPFVIWRIVEAERFKAEARAADRPPQIAVEAFDRERHVGYGGEVRLLAQIDPEEFVLEPSSGVRWIAPLWATDATDETAEPLGWIAHGAAPWSPAILSEDLVEDGPVAFIVAVEGRLIDPRRVESALDLLGRRATRGMVIVEPFLGRRDEIVAEAPGWRLRAALWVLGPVGMILGGLGWARGARVRRR